MRCGVGQFARVIRFKFADRISETRPAVAPQYASTIILVHIFLFTARLAGAAKYVRRAVDTFGPGGKRLASSVENSAAESGDQVETLLFESSPFGNLDAIVEQDSRTVYFYLNGPEPFGTRACWVRNLVPGPLALNAAELEAGLPPVLPRLHCHTNQPGPVPLSDQLRVVWFTEGNGAALFEQGELLAVIPPWSGLEGFHGYARDCASENEICWPLPDTPVLRERVTVAAETWEAWRSGRPFSQLQPQLLLRYEQRFGPSDQYFAIDGEKFPPRGLGVFRDESAVTLATVGVSLIPQPNVELAVENPLTQRRIEMALRIPLIAGELVENEVLRRLAGQLAGLAAMPWRRWTWFGQQQTCEFDFGPTRQQAVFIRSGSWQKTSDWELPSAFGEPASLLFVVPLTAPQFATVQTQGITSRLLDEFFAAGFLA
jgi:hypothetical protein